MYENISHVLRGAALMFYILLCVGIYPRRNESNLSKLLFMSMLLLVVLYLKDMVFIDDELWKSEFVVNLVMMIDLLYVPMMALFFMEAVIPGWVRPDRTIMAFSIPFLCVGVKQIPSFFSNWWIFSFTFICATWYLQSIANWRAASCSSS